MTARELILLCLNAHFLELHRLARAYTGELRSGFLADAEHVAQTLAKVESGAVRIVELDIPGVEA